MNVMQEIATLVTSFGLLGILAYHSAHVPGWVKDFIELAKWKIKTQNEERDKERESQNQEREKDRDARHAQGALFQAGLKEQATTFLAEAQAQRKAFDEREKVLWQYQERQTIRLESTLAKLEEAIRNGACRIDIQREKQP